MSYACFQGCWELHTELTGFNCPSATFNTGFNVGSMSEVFTRGAQDLSLKSIGAGAFLISDINDESTDFTVGGFTRRFTTRQDNLGYPMITAYNVDPAMCTPGGGKWLWYKKQACSFCTVGQLCDGTPNPEAGMFKNRQPKKVFSNSRLNFDICHCVEI